MQKNHGLFQSKIQKKMSENVICLLVLKQRYLININIIYVSSLLVSCGLCQGDENDFEIFTYFQLSFE